MDTERHSLPEILFELSSLSFLEPTILNSILRAFCRVGWMVVGGRARGGGRVGVVGDKAKGNVTNCSIVSKTESILKDHDTLVKLQRQG